MSAILHVAPVVRSAVQVGDSPAMLTARELTGVTTVDHLDERWINQTGQNIIRVVIGSYFTAVSLDLISGVDQRALFATVLGPESADLIGSALLLGLSVAFMIGVTLRLTGLMLALFVFTSSLIQNFLAFEINNISDFWRDLTLVCAVMMSYSFITAKAEREASIVSRTVRPQRTALGERARRSLQAEIRAALATGGTRAANEPGAPDDDGSGEERAAWPSERPADTGGTQASNDENIFVKI
ncbi:hypothetical protein DQW77_05660 [Roseovarius sp. TE539]|nr:hypothetical protein DQW77_05660 [Roseovarius sp. TE539]